MMRYWNCIFLILELCIFGIVCGTSCSDIFSEVACRANPNCTVAYKSDDTFLACVTRNPCDIKLDYNLPYPYGCSEKTCTIELLSSGLYSCRRTNFWDALSNIYFGTVSGIPVGYIAMNVLLLGILGLLIYMLPRMCAVAVCLWWNSGTPDDGRLSIDTFHFAPLGGKIYFSGLEFVSPNIHLRITEGGLRLKWWVDVWHVLFRYPSKIAKEADMESRNTRKRFVYRLSAFLTGVELSIFNNREKYSALQEELEPMTSRDEDIRYRNSFDDNSISQDHENPQKQSFFRRLCSCFKFSTTKLAEEEDAGISARELGDAWAEAGYLLESTIKERPWIYSVFPVSKVNLGRTCIYVSDPCLPTTAIFYAEQGVGYHWLKSTPSLDGSDNNLRSCSEVTWTNVKMMLKKNRHRIINPNEITSLPYQYDKSGFFRMMFRDFLPKLGSDDNLDEEIDIDDDPLDDDDEEYAMEVDKDINDFQELKYASYHTNRSSMKKRNPTSLTSGEFERESSAAILKHDEVRVSFASRRRRFAKCPTFCRWMCCKFSKFDVVEHDNDVEGQHSRGPSSDSDLHGIPGVDDRNKKSRGKKRKPKIPRRASESIHQLPEPDILLTPHLVWKYEYEYTRTMTSEDIEQGWIPMCPKTEISMEIGQEGVSSSITYGPWADKQRALFMDRFLPRLYSDVPVYNPKVGEPFPYLEARVEVLFHGDTSIRIPYRVRDVGLYGGMLAGKRVEEAIGHCSLWHSVSNICQAMLNAESRAATNLAENTSKYWLVGSVTTSDEMDALVTPIRQYQVILFEIAEHLKSSNSSLIGSRMPAAFAKALFEEYNGRESLLFGYFSKSDVELSTLRMTRLKHAISELPKPEKFLQYLRQFCDSMRLEFPDLSVGFEHEYINTLRTSYPSKLPSIDTINRRLTETRSRFPVEFSMDTEFETYAEFADASYSNSNFIPDSAGGPLSYARSCGMSCGWVNIKMRSMGTAVSRVSGRMDLISCSANGYEAVATSDLLNVQIGFSCVHADMLDASHVSLQTKVHYSNQWNGMQNYQLNMKVRKGLMNPIQEYAKYMSDLSADWSTSLMDASNELRRANASNPEDFALSLEYDFATFIPAEYLVSMNFEKVDWWFLVNEDNVVSQLESKSPFNTYILVHVPKLVLKLESDRSQFNPETYSWQYNLELDNNRAEDSWSTLCSLSLILPQNHHRRSVLHRSKLQDSTASCWNNPKILVFESLKLTGKYEYHTILNPVENCDIMEVDIELIAPRFIVFPEAVMAVKNLQRNYFGSSCYIMHPDEYKLCNNQNFRSRVAAQPSYTLSDQQVLNQTNAFEIRVDFNCTSPKFFLPIHLHNIFNNEGDLVDIESVCIVMSSSSVECDMHYVLDEFKDVNVQMDFVRIEIPGSASLGSHNAIVSAELFKDPQMGPSNDAPWRVSDMESPNVPRNSQAYGPNARMRSHRGSYRYPNHILPSKMTTTSGFNALMHHADQNLVSHLLIDGVKLQAGELYGRKTDCDDIQYTPLTTYFSSTKARIGKLRGDVQIAQIRAMENVLSSYELGHRILTHKVTKEANVILFCVQLKSAKYLPVFDTARKRKASPYAVITCGDQRYRTDTIYSSDSPVWDTTVIFRLPNESGILQITVHDGSYGECLEIGRFEAPIKTLLNDDNQIADVSPQVVNNIDAGLIQDWEKLVPMTLVTPLDLSKGVFPKTRRRTKRVPSIVWSHAWLTLALDDSTGCLNKFANLLRGEDGKHYAFASWLWEKQAHHHALSFTSNVATSKHGYRSLKVPTLARDTPRLSSHMSRSVSMDSEENDPFEQIVLGYGKMATSDYLHASDRTLVTTQKHIRSTVALTFEGVDNCLWAPGGTSVLHFNMQPISFFGDTRRTHERSWVFESTKQIDIQIRHFIQNAGGNQQDFGGKRKNRVGAHWLPAQLHASRKTAEGFYWTRIAEVRIFINVHMYEKLANSEQLQKLQDDFLDEYREYQMRKARKFNPKSHFDVANPKLSAYNAMNSLVDIFYGVQLMNMKYVQPGMTSTSTKKTPARRRSSLQSMTPMEGLEFADSDGDWASMQSGDESDSSFKSAQSFRKELERMRPTDSEYSSSSSASGSSRRFLESSSNSSTHSSDDDDAQSFGDIAETDIPIFVSTDVGDLSLLSQHDHVVEAGNLAPYLEHVDLDQIPFAFSEFPHEYVTHQMFGMQNTMRQRFVAGCNLGESEVFCTKISNVERGPCCLPPRDVELAPVQSIDDNSESETFGVVAQCAIGYLDIFATPPSIRELENMMLGYHPDAPGTAELCDYFDKQYLVWNSGASSDSLAKIDKLRLQLDVSNIGLRLLHSSTPRPHKTSEPIPVPYLVENVCHSIHMFWEHSQDFSKFGFEADDLLCSTGILNARHWRPEGETTTGVSAVAVLQTAGASFSGEIDHKVKETRIVGNFGEFGITMGSDSICVASNAVNVWRQHLVHFSQSREGVRIRRKKQWALLAGAAFQLELKLLRYVNSNVMDDTRESRAMMELNSACPFDEWNSLYSLSGISRKWFVSTRIRGLLCFIPRIDEEIIAEIAQVPLDRTENAVDLSAYAGVSYHLSETKFEELYPNLAEFFRAVLGFGETQQSSEVEDGALYVIYRSVQSSIVDVNMATSVMRLQMLTSRKRSKYHRDSENTRVRQWTTISMLPATFLAFDGTVDAFTIGGFAVPENSKPSGHGSKAAMYSVMIKTERCNFVTYPEISSTIKAVSAVTDTWIAQSHAEKSQNKISTHIRTNEIVALREKSEEAYKLQFYTFDFLPNTLNSTFGQNAHASSRRRKAAAKERADGLKSASSRGLDRVSSMYNRRSGGKNMLIHDGININESHPFEPDSSGSDRSSPRVIESSDYAAAWTPAEVETWNNFVSASFSEICIEFRHTQRRGQVKSGLIATDTNICWSRFSQQDAESTENTLLNCKLRDFVSADTNKLIAWISGKEEGKEWYISSEICETSIGGSLAVDTQSFETLKQVYALAVIRRIHADVPLYTVNNRQLKVFLDHWLDTYGEANREWQMMRSLVETMDLGVDNEEDYDEDDDRRLTQRGREAPWHLDSEMYNVQSKSPLSTRFQNAIRRTKYRLMQPEAGLVHVSFLCMSHIQTTQISMKPASNLNVEYSVENVTAELNSFQSNSIRGFYGCGQSLLKFDKSRNSYTPDGSITYKQNIPRVQIRGEYAVKPQRKSVTVNKSGERAMHGRTGSVTSISLQSEIPMVNNRPYLDNDVNSTYESTVCIQSSISSQMGNFESPGHHEPFEGLETVISVNIHVDPIKNKFMPEIVEQILVLQASLSQEINVVLKSLSRFAMKARKRSKNKARSRTVSAFAADTADDSSKLRTRYVLSLDLECVSLAFLASIEDPVHVGNSFNIDTGDMKVIVKSAFADDFLENGAAFATPISGTVEELWFAEFKMYAGEAFINSRNTERVVSVGTSIRALLDPRHRNDIRSGRQNALGLPQHLLNFTVRDSTCILKPRWWVASGMLFEDYSRAADIYGYMRARDCGESNASDDGDDSFQQGVFDTMDRNAREFWENLSKPIREEIVGDDNTTSAMSRVAIQLSVRNSTIQFMYSDKMVSPMHSFYPYGVSITVPLVTLNGHIENQIQHGVDTPRGLELASPNTSEDSVCTSQSMNGFLLVSSVNIAIVELRRHRRSSNPNVIKPAGKGVDVIEIQKHKSFGFKLKMDHIRVSVAGLRARCPNLERHRIDVQSVINVSGPVIQLESILAKHVHPIMVSCFLMDKDDMDVEAGDVVRIKDEDDRITSQKPRSAIPWSCEITMSMSAGQLTVVEPKPDDNVNTIARKVKSILPTFVVKSNIDYDEVEVQGDKVPYYKICVNSDVETKPLLISPSLVAVCTAVLEEYHLVVDATVVKAQTYDPSEAAPVPNHSRREEDVLKRHNKTALSFYDVSVYGNVEPLTLIIGSERGVPPSPHIIIAEPLKFFWSQATHDGATQGYTTMFMSLPLAKVQFGTEGFDISCHDLLLAKYSAEDLPMTNLGTFQDWPRGADFVNVSLKELVCDVSLNTMHTVIIFQDWWSDEYESAMSLMKSIGGSDEGDESEVSGAGKARRKHKISQEDAFGCPKIDIRHSYGFCVELNVEAVSFKCVMDVMESLALLRLDSICSRYCRIIPLGDDDFVDNLDVFARIRRIDGTFKGRINGGLKINHGASFHLVREYATIPEPITPFVSAEGLLIPTRYPGWQPWMKQKLATNHIIVRLHDNIYAEMTYVLGDPNAYSRNHTALFLVHLQMVSLILKEELPENILESDNSQEQEPPVCKLCGILEMELMNVKLPLDAGIMVSSLQQKITRYVSDLRRLTQKKLAKANALPGSAAPNLVSEGSESDLQASLAQRTLKSLGEMGIAVHSFNVATVHRELDNLKRRGALSIVGEDLFVHLESTESMGEINRRLEIDTRGNNVVYRFKYILPTLNKGFGSDESKLLVETIETQELNKTETNKKKIFDLPPFHVVMATRQLITPPMGNEERYLLSPIVQFIFLSDFKGKSIDVSTLGTDYTYLAMFLSGKSSQTTSTNSAAPVSVFKRNYLPDPEATGETFVFDPPVNVIGESTAIRLSTVLSRIGYSAEPIPSLAHETFCDNIETLLAALHDLERAIDTIFDAREA